MSTESGQLQWISLPPHRGDRPDSPSLTPPRFGRPLPPDAWSAGGRVGGWFRCASPASRGQGGRLITPAQRAEIRRLFYGEHWKVGTIAAQLGLHRETVRAAVERETAGVRPSLCRPSILDPYLPFIRDTLAQYPRLRATRIHEMVRQRGYAGSVFPVRRLVRRLRPESGRAVYRRVVTLVGEQAQVDWGSFGKVHIGHGTRTVSGFVMVLGYSRALAALFTLDQTLESFLRGHVDAFEALGGAARNLVYDNLRSAVLDRRGAAVQFHPRLLDLAGHYHFAPRPCTPGRGNEKGKIERQIQYLRASCKNR